MSNTLTTETSFNTQIATWIKEARSSVNRGNAKGLPKGWVVVGGGRSLWFVADENDNLVAQGADLAATLRAARKEA